MNKSSFIAYNGLNVKQRVTDCLLFAQSSFHDMFVFCQKKRSIAFFLKVDDQHGNELWSPLARIPRDKKRGIGPEQVRDHGWQMKKVGLERRKKKKVEMEVRISFKNRCQARAQAIGGVALSCIVLTHLTCVWFLLRMISYLFYK